MVAYDDAYYVKKRTKCLHEACFRVVIVVFCHRVDKTDLLPKFISLYATILGLTDMT